MSAFDRVQEIGKAVLAAVAAAAGGVILSTAADAEGTLTNPELPNTSDEWVSFGVAVVLVYAATYLKRNFPSVVKAKDDVALAEQRVREGKQSV